MNWLKTLKIVYKKNESRDHSQIILIVYEFDNCYVYSINCKLGRFVRSFYPRPNSLKYQTERSARKAAVKTMQQWVAHSRSAKERLNRFDLIEVDQQELFLFQ